MQRGTLVSEFFFEPAICFPTTTNTIKGIGNMANANEVLGFLHGFYGLGAVLSPLIATTMITKGQRLSWYTFYYVMVSQVLHHPPKGIISLIVTTDWSGSPRTRYFSCRFLVRDGRRFQREE